MDTTIAILLTCYNRKQKTLNCLQALYESKLPLKYKFQVFLIDDGCTDGTGEAVKNNYPDVTVIFGNGNLFWNQGMRLAWKTAANEKDFDFYFWLNDDTLLYKNAISDMLKCIEEGRAKYNCEGLVTGACQNEFGKMEFSYGGRVESGPVIPNGNLQTCTYINGNAVLVPRSVYKEIGSLSPDYTHGMGDFDYGLRVIQKEFKCYTTKTFVAICPPNDGIPSWCDPKVPFRKRWKLVYSPLGLNMNEYLLFRKKFWGKKWRFYAIKAYAKVVMPKFYSKFSQS